MQAGRAAGRREPDSAGTTDRGAGTDRIPSHEEQQLTLGNNNRPVTPDAIDEWFTSNGWRLIHRDADSLAFANRRGIPKGLEIRLSVNEAAGAWRIACQVVAQDGQSRSVGDVIQLDSMSGLPVAVATFGPRSFTHVIQAFAEELELGPQR